MLPSWSNLNEPKQTAPTSEPGLKALFQDIRVTVDQEAQIIQAVFPNKEEVMRVFLQRVFAQVVSSSDHPCNCDYGNAGTDWLERWNGRSNNT